MLTQDKRQPSYEDTDLMPFGRFKGKVLSDVPASYLKWLYNEMKPRWFKYELTTQSTELDKVNLKTFNYIHNSMDAIDEELKRTDRD